MARVHGSLCRWNTLFKVRRLLGLIGHSRRSMSSIVMMVDMYVRMRMGLDSMRCRRWWRGMCLGPMKRQWSFIMIVKHSVAYDRRYGCTCPHRYTWSDLQKKR